MKTKTRLIWSQARNAWAIFAMATAFAFFVMLPGSVAAECVQTGTEVICTGPYYSNSDLLNRENPGDNVEVLTIDGTEAPVTVTRNDLRSGVSLLSDSSWEKNITLNLKGDVSVINTAAWVNEVPGIKMVQEGQGSLFFNMSPLSSIETADACLTCGNHGIYTFITSDENPGDIGIDAAGTISTVGPGAHGIYSVHNGLGNIDVNWGGNMDITGETSHGIYAHHLGEGGIAVESTGAIETTGNETHGVYAFIPKNDNNADMSVAIDSGEILTSGTEAHAVNLEHRGTGDRILNVGDGALVHASGQNAHGLHIGNTGSGDNALTVAGTVIGGDEDAYAIVSQTETGKKSTLSIEDTAKISAASGNAILNNGGDSETTVAAGAQISGAIRLGDGSDDLTFNGTDISDISVFNGGDDRSGADEWIDTLRFNDVSGDLDGRRALHWEAIEIDQSSVITGSGYWQAGQEADADTGVWIKNGANLQVVDGFHLKGRLNIEESAALSGMGSSYTVAGPVYNAGAIDLHNASVSDTLTVEGDYYGDDGQLHLDTMLGDDASPTDKLIVEGDTSGSTDVFIYNAAGGGDQTIQGIEVISVGGTSAEEHFTQANAVEAGAYEYFLFRGTPDEENSNFYLRSEYVEPDPGTEPEPEPEVYRSAVPGYVLGQAAVQEMAYASMGGRLHKRVGEQQTFKWDYCGCDAEKPEDQMWFRMAGQKLDIDGRRQFGLEQDTLLLQLGKDLFISYDDDEDDHSHRHTGLMISYGKTEADFHDRDRRRAGLGKTTGDMTAEMGAIGVYHTRYAHNGIYQDFVGQVHHTRNRYTDMNGQKASQNGTGFGASVEAGRPWQIGESLWLIEPQAQLSYQFTRYGDFSDNVATTDDFNSQNLRGRIGARLAWNDRINDTERTKTMYVTASVLHDFLDPETVDIGGDSIKEKPDEPTWGELGLHGQYRLTDLTYLYGSANYQRSIDSGSREGYGGELGIRAAW